TQCTDPCFLLQEERMLFSYHQVQEHPQLLLAMTGLSHAEWHPWLPHVQYAWDQYVQQHSIDRDDRQRPYGAGRAESTWLHMPHRLFCFLYDVNVPPSQEILAFAFGMGKSTANAWIQLGSDLVKKAWDHGGYVRARDPTQLATVFASETEST